MTVEELFQELSYGELSNLAVAVDGSGTIKKEHQNRVIHFANEGLGNLHSRFPLIETQEVLTLTGTVLEKNLDPDVLLVTSILTPWGESLSFNTKPIPGTIYVYDRKLHVPAATGELQVTYQRRHPALVPITSAADLAQNINLMPELHEALTAYIAWKIYSGMNSQDSLAIGAGYKNKYEQVVLDALNQGLLPSELLPVQKLEARGFV